MDDFWGIMLFVCIGVLTLIGFITMIDGISDASNKSLKLEEATQSAQIKEVCNRDYQNKSYKDVPIKCLDFWGFTNKQEGK